MLSELRGVVCLEEGVVGIVVGNEFSPDAIEEANKSESFPIILTTKTRLPLTLLNLTLDIIHKTPIKLS
ncbi:31305_t:CDS:1, partial [Racocetra persica]